jgi:hypothetical protein
MKNKKTDFFPAFGRKETRTLILFFDKRAGSETTLF